MIDPYTLDAFAVPHPQDGDGLIGWSIRLRLPWFRALPVSCVERAEVRVGDEVIAERDLLFCVDGRPRLLSELATMPDRYWSVAERLQVGIRSPRSAPPPGTVVTVELTLRMPDSAGGGGDWSRRVARATVRVPDTGRAPWPLGVCTFSVSGELRNGRSMRSCLEQIAALGVFTGVEILGAQVVEGYPAPTRQWLDRFSRTLRTTGLAPVCYDAFIDSGRTPVPACGDAEIMLLAEAELDIAAALGCSHVRLNVPPRRPLLDQLEAAAEQRDLVVLTELHARTALDPDVAELLALLTAMRSPRLGVILDLSCVMQALPRGFVRSMADAGLPADTVRIIAESWSAGLPLPALRNMLAGNPAAAVAMPLAQRAYRLFRRSDTSWLPDVMPFIRIIHGKFFEMDDGGEPAIPYGEVLAMLRRAQFDGYVMSEYEGHLWQDSPDTFGQLLAHRRMISAVSNG